MRKVPHQDQFGFFTFVQNNSTVDYLNLAYVQALSIKISMPNAKYAVAVDNSTFELLEDNHKKVFDYIVKIENDYSADDEWKLKNEWQAFWLTPFKETIKLEADLLFTNDITHWLPALRLKDVVLSTNCKNYLQENIVDAKYHRKIFLDNDLPNVYNGLMYFRFSRVANEFFKIAMSVYQNWDQVVDNLKNIENTYPSTDLVYAIAAKIIGTELVTVPTLDFINFTHMKPLLQGWGQHENWPDAVNVEFDLPMIRVNNQNQYHPIHYHQKNFITEEIINEYEYHARRLSIID